MYILKNPELRAKKKHNYKKPELKPKCTFLRNRGKKQNVHLSKTGAKRKMHIAKKPELRAKCKFLINQVKKPTVNLSETGAKSKMHITKKP